MTLEFLYRDSSVFFSRALGFGVLEFPEGLCRFDGSLHRSSFVCSPTPWLGCNQKQKPNQQTQLH